MKSFGRLFKHDLRRYICSKLFLVCCAAAVASAAVTYKDFDPYKNSRFDPQLYHPSLLITPYVCSILMLGAFIAYYICSTPSGTTLADDPLPECSKAQQYFSKLLISLLAATVMFMLSTLTIIIVGHKRCFSGFEAGRLAGVFLPCFVVFLGFAAMCVLISVLTDNTYAAIFICIGFIGTLILLSETQLHYLGQPKELVHEETTESAVYNELLGRFEKTEETITLTEPNPEYAGETLTRVIELSYYLNPSRCLRIALDSSQYPTHSQLTNAITALRSPNGDHPQSYDKRLFAADELENSFSASLLILAEALIFTVIGAATFIRRKVK